MVTYSKLYEPPLCYLKCSQIHVHPGKSCVQYFFWNTYASHIKSYKHFLPILLSPIIFQIKNLDREKVVKAFKLYLQLVTYSSFISSVFFSSICLLRKMNGKFTKYSSVFWPAYLAGQGCWIFPENVFKATYFVLQQAILDTFLQKSTNSLLKLILNSKLLQTILFMLNSAIIMHNKRTKYYTGFWFVQPNAQQINNNGNDVKACTHENTTCLRYLYEGLKKYMSFGLLLDVYGMLMRSKITDKNKGLRSIGLKYLQTFRPKMTFFFLTNVSLYRISSCLLSKYSNNISDGNQHLIAAFLSGISHMFLDKITFLSLAFVITSQIISNRFSDYKTENSYIKFLQKLPIRNIAFPILLAQICQDFYFQNDKLSSIGKESLNAMTAGRPQKTVHYMLSNSLEQILKTANEYVL